MNAIDKYYMAIMECGKTYISKMAPHLRMLIRFFALPYAYFILMNWKECMASPYQVFKDFIYIFFVLKDFPDYYSVFRLWEKDRSEWKFYYGSIYNPYQRGKLRKEIQKKEYEILFEDKFVCHQLCAGAGIPVPEFLGYVQPADDFINYVSGLFDNKSNIKIIIKSSRGKGGKDIFLGYKENGEIFIKGNNEIGLLKDFKLEYPSIIQRYINQHHALSEISSSVNTIRTETILTRDNKVEIIGAFIRFGLDGNFLDNQCAGGLSIGVNISTGALYEYAMNGRGEKYYSHPDTGVIFDGLKIPLWREVIELSETVQRHFPYYKLLGPDIAITPDGPLIIEINATPDHAGLEMDYGPVLKNKKVWEVFNEYDLLINDASKKAW